MRHLFLLFLLLSFSARAHISEHFPGLVQLIIGQHVSTGPPNDQSRLTSDTVVFSFYAKPHGTVAARRVSFYFDWRSSPRRERAVETDYRSWLAPMIFTDDSTSGYYRAYLTCVSRKGDWYEVIVNENTQEKLWIKDQRFVRFHDWTNISKTKFLTISVNTAVYIKADTNSPRVDVVANCFRIDQVRGEWMQVSSADPELCNSYNQPRLKKVWVLFRTPKALRITVVVH